MRIFDIFKKKNKNEKKVEKPSFLSSENNIDEVISNPLHPLNLANPLSPLNVLNTYESSPIQEHHQTHYDNNSFCDTSQVNDTSYNSVSTPDASSCGSFDGGSQ